MNEAAQAAGKIIAENYLADPDLRKVLRGKIFEAVSQEGKALTKELLKSVSLQFEDEVKAKQERFVSYLRNNLDRWWEEAKEEKIAAAKQKISRMIDEVSVQDLSRHLETAVKAGLKGQLHKLKLAISLEDLKEDSNDWDD